MTRSRHIHDVLAEEALVLALEGLGCVPVEDGGEWLQPYHEISKKNYVGVIVENRTITQSDFFKSPREAMENLRWTF